MGNLGSHPDGRTILLDCAYPGAGPACHDLGWYLAINRARMPETKEAHDRAVPGRARVATASTPGVVGPPARPVPAGRPSSSSGWEKALGDGDELAWWVERGRAGAARL